MKRSISLFVFGQYALDFEVVAEFSDGELGTFVTYVLVRVSEH